MQVQNLHPWILDPREAVRVQIELRDRLVLSWDGREVRTGVKSVYVSPGHLIDVAHAVEFALDCCTRYRLPEPTRFAHRVAGGAKLPK
jgi:deoxyinosine 3'endonuclease (endonuclease V)